MASGFPEGPTVYEDPHGTSRQQPAPYEDVRPKLPPKSFESGTKYRLKNTASASPRADEGFALANTPQHLKQTMSVARRPQRRPSIQHNTPKQQLDPLNLPNTNHQIHPDSPLPPGQQPRRKGSYISNNVPARAGTPSFVKTDVKPQTIYPPAEFNDTDLTTIPQTALPNSYDPSLSQETTQRAAMSLQAHIIKQKQLHVPLVACTAPAHHDWVQQSRPPYRRPSSTHIFQREALLRNFYSGTAPEVMWRRLTQPRLTLRAF